MRTQSCLLIILCVAIFACFTTTTITNAEWKVIAPKIATILAGVSFPESDVGWVTGAANGIGPVILKTTDGGQTWKNQNKVTDSLTFLDISMHDDEHGYASGLGLGKIRGGAFTTDGTNWNSSEAHTAIQAFQSTGTLDANTYWQVGTWVSLVNLNGNGVMFSHDGGYNFVGYNWNQETLARYGSFLTEEVGWIAGGDFPTSGSDGEYRFNHHLSIVGNSFYFRTENNNNSTDNSTFAAALSMTNDGGQTWTSLYNKTFSKKSGYYFNGISFVNENQGWLVGEGVNKTTGAPYAFIWATTDGGNSWNEQQNVQGGSFIQIQMLNATFGWAVGGTNIGSIGMKGTFWKTVDGLTWIIDSALADTYIMNIDAYDENTAYAVGITLEGLASVFAYTS